MSLLEGQLAQQSDPTVKNLVQELFKGEYSYVTQYATYAILFWLSFIDIIRCVDVSAYTIFTTDFTIESCSNHANPEESSHIIPIWKEEELLYHIIQNLRGCMRMHMNCTAMKRITRESWELLRICKNHENCPSIRITKNYLRITRNHSENCSRIMRITENYQELLENQWESPKITKNWSRITKNCLSISENHKNCSRIMRITKNCFRIMRITENYLRTTWQSVRITKNQLESLENHGELLKNYRNQWRITQDTLKNHVNKWESLIIACKSQK